MPLTSRVPHLLRISVLAALLVSLSSAPAYAQALAQLRLSGTVAAPSGDASLPSAPYGHLVEIEIEALTLKQLAQAPVEIAAAANLPEEAPGASLVLHLHVVAGTTGASLVELIASRLQRLGADVTLTGSRDSDDAASLWIAGAKGIHLRMGGGLTGQVSCVEGPPQSMKLLPGTAIDGQATAFVTASTAIVMKNRAPIRGRAAFSASLEGLTNSPEAATALWEAASTTWVSDRPGSDSWRPVKMADGATITGVSLRVAGQGDWGLVVQL